MSREIFSVRVASARNLKMHVALTMRGETNFQFTMNEWSRLDIFVLIGYVFCSIHDITVKKNKTVEIRIVNTRVNHEFVISTKNIRQYFYLTH